MMHPVGIMKHHRLKPNEEQLLREVVLKHRPGLLPLLDLIGARPLTADQRESLREPVATELVDEGFDEGGSINPRGADLENQIDRLWLLSDRT
jgi:hypothetical protein